MYCNMKISVVNYLKCMVEVVQAKLTSRWADREPNTKSRVDFCIFIKFRTKIIIFWGL